MTLANDETAIQAWEKVYLQAVLETDNSVLPKVIEAAEAAIQTRIVELARDHYGTEKERKAISDALRALAVLREERVERRLSGPSPKRSLDFI